ncbi:structural maintenance of chromosomes protein 2-like, partial [Anoplophora glabripennis]|uniref:structural maintenance of chromosomes protein 2-like n=1 Tax=Anoplophora glabripennis TaxID=217634 RepID=UPI00087393DE
MGSATCPCQAQAITSVPGLQLHLCISQLAKLLLLRNDRVLDDSIKLQDLESQLKEKEKQEAKANASVKTIKESINTEQKKKNQLEKNLKDDSKILQEKEQELNKVKLLFESLKKDDAKDNEAFALSQRKFEAISAGMEVNEDGEAETLQEQLMNAKQEAARACTESNQASTQLTFCQSRLEEKQKELGSNSTDYEKDKIDLNNREQEVNILEVNIKKLKFSEEQMNKLLEKRRILHQEIRGLQEKIENFDAHKPYTKFRYSEPEPNFNKHCVKGVVCRLITCSDSDTCIALETAAGGRLYNVVVDSEVTSKKLLQKGNLQQRTTFIPLNKIRANKMNNDVIRLAQELVGKENCRPALSLIEYDKELQTAMEFIFGNVFICKDMNVAKQVTFHDHIRRKCVTLDGDVTDPSGTLCGGAPQKGGSLLLQLSDIQQYE